MKYAELKAKMDADTATPADVDAYMATCAADREKELAEEILAKAARDAAGRYARVRAQSRIAWALRTTH